jgi:curli production assembly/transport component CsgG
MIRKLASLAGMLALSACTSIGEHGRSTIPQMSSLAVIPQRTQTQNMLGDLPPPQRPIAIAVYGFTDQTGQFKPTENGQTLSRAVTQGAGSILVKALQDASNRQWFTIVERESLRNLLNERQIIREMRERYLGETNVNPKALPALLFAGVLLEGGIIGYDTNTVTGGAGAAFLGIGGRTEYRQDTVTVYLRAVSVRTGEVLTTVTASKTIASQALGASAFKFVAFKELLEAEAGFTTNEPDHLALQQAIEKAVYSLVLEGVELKLWDFADTKAGWPLLWRYKQERAGVYSAGQAQEAMERARKASPMSMKPREVPMAVKKNRDESGVMTALMRNELSDGRLAGRSDEGADGRPGVQR